MALLRSATTLTLATCADNVPWAADVYFANVGFDLWFVSSTDSRHCTNLKQNASCAATVHAEASDWTKIKGLQFEGRAFRCMGTDSIKLLIPYFEKFPFAKAIFIGLSERAGVSKMAVYKFVTDRVFYIDNSLGFGSKYSCKVSDGRRIEEFRKL